MRGFVEIKEDSYEDTIEHLHRIKLIACKLIKKLSTSSDLYNDSEEEDCEEDVDPRERKAMKRKGRYEY